jgi:hypothetical protein
MDPGRVLPCVVRYPLPQGMMTIEVVKAVGLRAEEFGLGSIIGQSYARLRVGAVCHRTSAITRSANPDYRTALCNKFCYVVEIPEAQTLEIDIWNQSVMGGDRILAKGSVALLQLIKKQPSMLELIQNTLNKPVGQVNIKIITLKNKRDPPTL